MPSETVVELMMTTWPPMTTRTRLHVLEKGDYDISIQPDCIP